MSLQDDIRDLDVELTDKQKLTMLQALQTAGQKWLSDDKYFEQYERGIKIVSDKEDDDLLMQFWLYGRDYDAEKKEDEWVIMPVGVADWPPEGYTKQEAMEALGVMFGTTYPKHMLVNIVHSTEAWMASHPKDADMDNVPMPSQDPKRMEVVLVSAVSMDRRLSQYMAEIERDKTGKFTGLKPINDIRHNPKKPMDPLKMRDYLSEYIYSGYGKVRGIGEKPEEKKGKSDAKEG